MEKLKPCPHCGGEADVYRRFIPGADYIDNIVVHVKCECCGASGKEFPVSQDPCDDAVGWDDPEISEASKSAISAWNLRRADEEYEYVMKEVLSAVGSLRDIVEQRANREDGEPLPGEVMPGIKA